MFRGAAGHERGAFHEIVQLVVVPGDDAFGEDHQRTVGFSRELHGRFQRLAIRTFAVNAEYAKARE